MLRPYLAAGAVVAVALAGIAMWLVDTGYRRGLADCHAEALRTRAEIEAQWIRDADASAIANQERRDAVAAIDAADAGDTLCLPPDSVQRLRAIR